MGREVTQDGRQVKPTPARDLEVGEVGLPHLVGGRGFVPELIDSLHHQVSRTRNQAMGP